MDLSEFKLKALGIDKKLFGKVYSFVDFGNVNYWFEKDERDAQNKLLGENEKLIVDIEKLADFLDLFSDQKRFYYGWNARLETSWHLPIKAEKYGFIKVTKPIQFIKHYLDDLELKIVVQTKIKQDRSGNYYIEIPKSNFDVEISVDSIRLLKKYDTFCLLSGDSDFVRLIEFLKKNNKNIIIIAAGEVVRTLKENADNFINAQRIKGQITIIKKTPPVKAEFKNRIRLGRTR